MHQFSDSDLARLAMPGIASDPVWQATISARIHARNPGLAARQHEAELALTRLLKDAANMPPYAMAWACHVAQSLSYARVAVLGLEGEFAVGDYRLVFLAVPHDGLVRVATSLRYERPLDGVELFTGEHVRKAMPDAYQNITAPNTQFYL